MNNKFRKKPVVIEAFQMTEERRLNNVDWPQWLHEACNKECGEKGAIWPEKRPQSDGKDHLIIGTLEGNHRVSWDDYIIQGVQGELYPCKPDIFEETYEKVRSYTESVSCERKHQNHHRELTEDQTVIDLGNGEFVADNEMIPLLEALNECGLITRTHCHGHETGHSFISILMKNDLRIEIKEAYENASGRQFQGEKEILLMWKRTN